MSTNVKFTPPPITTYEKSWKKGLTYAKEQILNDCNLYVRLDSGDLRDSGTAVPDGNSLILTWDAPYARRVYYTGTPLRVKNPQASLMWAHKAKRRHGSEWQKMIERGMTL